jgi:hypothetical protein
VCSGKFHPELRIIDQLLRLHQTPNLLQKMHRNFLALVLFLKAFLLQAQFDDPNLKYLLMDRKLQLEATTAVNAMYNFKFDAAEKDFQWMRYRYPSHPLPVFLLGLMEWWKIQPDIDNKSFDDSFTALMDTSILLAENLQRKDKQSIEAAFFLAASHGFKGRLLSERGSWTKAAIEGKKSLTNLQITKQNDTLSPEFLFGVALFNYYSVWIPDNYKFLRPVMALFPRGDKEKGIIQLKEVAFNAFYTRTEAYLYLARIYANEENQPQKALPMCEYLAATFPDNPYFQRLYARMCYSLGKTAEVEKVSLDILDKINRQMPGYEATSGRYASYYLGYIYRHSYKKDKQKARKYFDQCLQFCNKNEAFKTGYYKFTLLNLMQISDEEKNPMMAVEYARKIQESTDRNDSCHKLAKDILKKYPKEAKESKKGFWSMFGF